MKSPQRTSGATRIAPAIALCAALAHPLASLACPATPAGARTVESPRHVLHYRTSPASPAVGKPFAIDMIVCPKNPQAGIVGLDVDARMPEHRHGMNYRATVKSQKDGHYRAEGLMFHMPGRWEFMFDVRDASGTEHLTHDTTIR